MFSIIVPTHERPVQLGACLAGLAGLDFPREGFEVIVVDDGSQTPPAAVVARLRDRLNVTLVTQPHAGPATARNTGATHARGTFLAFIDDDCAPAPDWLQNLATRLAASPDRAFGGRSPNALPDNHYSSASDLLVAYLCAHYNGDTSHAQFLTSNNLAMTAERFHEIGGFDTSFHFAAAEDRELCDRWLWSGYRMTYAQDALVHHSHPMKLHTFFRQHFRYGRGAFRFHRLRAARGSGRLTLEPPSFYLNLLRYPLSQARGHRVLVLASLITLSQLANVVGFLWEGASGVRK